MPSEYSLIIVHVGTFKQGGKPPAKLCILIQSHLAISAQPFIYIKNPCFSSNVRNILFSQFSFASLNTLSLACFLIHVLNFNLST